MAENKQGMYLRRVARSYGYTTPCSSAPVNAITQTHEVRRSAVASKTDPMGAVPLRRVSRASSIRVFEGTVLEGVVTNHIDGGFAGPILVMLTTDYYSHDHQQLLMPQGTRPHRNRSELSSGQNQRKLMVTFHRAVCPDGFLPRLWTNTPAWTQLGPPGLASQGRQPPTSPASPQPQS